MKAYDINIKDIVKDNSVQFVRYRQGVAYYSVYVSSKDQCFMFPVPLEDVGDATLTARDKAIIYMRYIRRAIKEGSFVPHIPEQEH